MVKYVSTGTFLRKKEENLVGYISHVQPYLLHIVLWNKYYSLNANHLILNPLRMNNINIYDE